MPDCEGKVCGDDGCGVSCGECTGPQEECQNGKCVCQPDCAGKECGPDGCGGNCGQCPSGCECETESDPYGYLPTNVCKPTELWDPAQPECEPNYNESFFKGNLIPYAPPNMTCCSQSPPGASTEDKALHLLQHIIYNFPTNIMEIFNLLDVNDLTYWSEPDEPSIRGWISLAPDANQKLTGMCGNGAFQPGFRLQVRVLTSVSGGTPGPNGEPLPTYTNYHAGADSQFFKLGLSAVPCAKKLAVQLQQLEETELDDWLDVFPDHWIPIYPGLLPPGGVS